MVTISNSRNYWTREVKLDWTANPFTSEGEAPRGTSLGPFQQLSYLSLAKQALDGLFNSGLGFQVKIHIVFDVDGPSDTSMIYPMSFVPLGVSPLSLSGGSASYGMGTFIKTVAAMMRNKIEYAEALPSGVKFKRIRTLRLLSLPEASLQAMAPVGQPIPLGMKYKDLPRELKNKMACLNIQNTDEQCFKWCLVCYKLKIYEMENPHRWPGKYAVETSSATPGRPKKEQTLTFKDGGLDFSMIPTDRAPTYEEIANFEAVNLIGIYLYDWHEAKVGDVATHWVRPIRRPAAGYSDEVKLLLWQGHFVFIKNFNALASRFGQSNSSVRTSTVNCCHACHRCMKNFHSEQNLASHIEKGDCIRALGTPVKSPTILPPLRGKNKDQIPVLSFKGQNKRIGHPLVIYADFETYFHRMDDQRKGQTTTLASNDNVASFAYLAVASQGFAVPPELATKLYRGSDPAETFVIDLLRLVAHYQSALRNPVDIVITDDQEQGFQAAPACYMCGVRFGAYSGKVRDHNHFDGSFRGAACDWCNKAMKCPRTVPIYFHNMKGYDGHLLIKAIQRLMNTEGPWQELLAQASAEHDEVAAEAQGENDDEATLPNNDLLTWMRQDGLKLFMQTRNRNEITWLTAMKHIAQHKGFLTRGSNVKTIRGIGACIARVLEQAPWDSFVPSAAFTEESVHKSCKLRLEVIAKTSESYPMIRFGPLKFLDSANFLKSSLDGLIKSQRSFASTLAEAFPYMSRFHPWATPETMEILLQKIPMPFTAMTGLDCFSYPALLSQESYNNDLSGERCDDTAYGKIRRVVQTLHLDTFGQYHDVYLYTDVYALADCFEAFRNTFKQEYDLDVAHFISLPSAAMNALLLKTGASIQLISEPNGGWPLMNDVNDNIRGGLSCIFQPFASANNPRCPNYDSSLPSSWIGYNDVNSLYPYAMSHALPVGDYESVELPENDADRCLYVQNLMGEYSSEDPLGYMIVADLDVPLEMHDTLDFAPIAKRSTDPSELSELQRERQQIFGGNMNQEKLMPFLGKQEEVGHHIELLKFYTEHMGVQLLKVHRVWKWRQSKWMAPFMHEVSSKRAQTTDACLKDTLKITMNSIYGMLLQNKERYSNTAVYVEEESFIGAATRSEACNWDVFDMSCDGFLGVVNSIKPHGVVLDTPRIVGFAVLELAKLTMYKAHYLYFKKRYGDDYKLLMMDTDSFIAHVTTPDFIQDMQQANALDSCPIRFDLSKRSATVSCSNKGILGCFKHEPGDDEIAEFAGLQAKMYSLSFASGSVEQKGKGIPQKCLKAVQHEVFKKQLFDPELHHVNFNRIQSKKHSIQHLHQVKKGLGSFNDKVFQVDALWNLPLGHYRAKL